jgi:hypothetical protein
MTGLLERVNLGFQTAPKRTFLGDPGSFMVSGMSIRLRLSQVYSVRWSSAAALEIRVRDRRSPSLS